MHKQYELLAYSREGQSFRYLKTGEVYNTSLLGVYQPINALLAASAAAEHINRTNISQGIDATVWPARLEIISQFPFVLLDGAHNLQACRALVASLARLSENAPFVFLTGIMIDKDYKEMLNLVLNAI